ncbi:unnamed protein product, partial [Owenia fusiformis]
GSSMEKQKKIKKPKSKETSDVFSLKNVTDLGGNKLDYQLCENIDDDTEVYDNTTDAFETEPIHRSEIAELINELGLAKYRPEKDEIPEKKEKIKLAERPLTDEERQQDQEEQDKKHAESLGKKKKETKNKFKKKAAEHVDADDESIQHDEVSSTTHTHGLVLAGAKVYSDRHIPRKYTLVKQGDWLENLNPSDPKSFPKLPVYVVTELEKFAVRLLAEEVNLYSKGKEKEKRSDTRWMKTVASSGTLTDKLAALTVLFQDSPVHNLASLDKLISMVNMKGKRECLLAVDTLKEVFINDLLPEDRKLHTFDQHPLSLLEDLSSGNRDSRDRRLLMWYFEAQLKDKYSTFVHALESISHDTISATKKKAIGTMFELLSSNPEQEKILLSMLVNKLGDPDRKLASQAAHFLTKLVAKHPNMTFVVVLDVERLLYRPNISVKAQYYAICFLNQLILSEDDKELAARLIKVYFSFFKYFVKKGEVDGKMLSSLLTGVNRAYPYAKGGKLNIDEELNTLYKVVHIVNFNTSIQALMLLYQVMDSNEAISDRYYTALYRKLIDPGLKNSSKQPMFLNLLYKSLKKDISEKRLVAFIKRLLQVCAIQTPSFICGALLLLSEVLTSKKGIVSVEQVGEESDEEEHFHDAPDDTKYNSDSDDDVKPDIKPDITGGVSQHTPSWVHRNNYAGGVKKVIEHYDPYHRNPLYSLADRECIWELEKLETHFHPSVAMFAQAVMKGESIQYTSDPLQDFTLIKFLDRFVYRNPKKKLADSVSVMRRKEIDVKGVKALAVNSDKFLETTEEKIPVDEKFFHRYFSQVAAKKKSKKADDEDSDAGSISDDEFDEYLGNLEQNVDERGDMLGDLGYDFASDMGKKQNKKKSKANESSDEDDDEIDEDDASDLEDDDLSEEEPDFGDGDFGDAFASDASDEDGKNDVEFDEEDVAFSDDDDELGEVDFSKDKKAKKRSQEGPLESMRGKKRKSDGAGLFAAAEEFADMMDDNAGAKFDMGGGDAMSNKDNASAKQLKWELERDRKMRGADWRQKKRSKKPFRPGQKKQQKGKRR